MTHLLIHSCGPYTSIQDRGRSGWLRFGLAAAGAADPLALVVANSLAGNPVDAACIELVMMGITLEAVGGSVRLAMAGAPMPLTIDGASVPDHRSFVLAPGCRLHIGSARSGVYACLAVEGGLDIKPELGSMSLHPRAGIGGLNGGYLAAGNVLPLMRREPTHSPSVAANPVPMVSNGPLRVVLGPQDTHVTAQALETFFSATYRVTPEVDRMGCRLDGPKIEHAKGFNIVSDGIVGGSIQIPGSGLPIVMLVDRQTTGGYPKIATVITPDLRLLMQRRPGDSVLFAPISIEAAQAIARSNRDTVLNITRSIANARRAIDRSDILLSMNLAGDALNALDSATWVNA